MFAVERAVAFAVQSYGLEACWAVESAQRRLSVFFFSVYQWSTGCPRRQIHARARVSVPTATKDMLLKDYICFRMIC